MDLNEVDEFVRRADELGQSSHAERINYLNANSLAYRQPPATIGGPFGAAYTRWVRDQWSVVANRTEYSLEYECDNNVKATNEQLSQLYPFVSRDARFISQYMMGVYFLMQLLDDAPGRRVVEYGVGWAHVATSLMQSGWQVLAIDIDRKWLKLLELRSSQLLVSEKLETLCGQFGDLPSTNQKFSAAVFYECFHHALNHDELLARLVERMEDGGVIIFAAEAIYSDFPLEWGLRQDGHSIWAIRHFGWMELGFSEDYFIRLCRRHNLELTRHVCEEAGPFGVAYKGVFRRDGVAFGRTLLTSTETGFYPAEVDCSVLTRFTKGDSIIEIPCGATEVRIELRNWLNRDLYCLIERNGEAVWEGSIAAGASENVFMSNMDSGYFSVLNLRSECYCPVDLGINDDSRQLGVAVGRVLF